MRLLSTEVHNRWHPALEPVATVKPGEEITFECRDGLDGQLTRESTHDSVAGLSLGLGHPLTGPVYVEGAEPVPAQVTALPIFLALIVAIVVGVGFGLYPAYRAAMLDPIEALRHE